MPRRADTCISQVVFGSADPSPGKVLLNINAFSLGLSTMKGRAPAELLPERMELLNGLFLRDDIKAWKAGLASLQHPLRRRAPDLAAEMGRVFAAQDEDLVDQVRLGPRVVPVSGALCLLAPSQSLYFPLPLRPHPPTPHRLPHGPPVQETPRPKRPETDRRGAGLRAVEKGDGELSVPPMPPPPSDERIERHDRAE